jgi:hypothetical protein
VTATGPGDGAGAVEGSDRLPRTRRPHRRYSALTAAVSAESPSFASAKSIPVFGLL